MSLIDQSEIISTVQEIVQTEADHQYVEVMINEKPMTVTMELYEGEHMHVLWNISESIIDPIGDIIPDELHSLNNIDHDMLGDPDEKLNRMPTSAERLGETVVTGTDIIRNGVCEVIGERPSQFFVMNVDQYEGKLHFTLATSITIPHPIEV